VSGDFPFFLGDASPAMALLEELETIFPDNAIEKRVRPNGEWGVGILC
jgi:hypothetical protein